MTHVESVEGQNCVLDTGVELKISRARKRDSSKPSPAISPTTARADARMRIADTPCI